MTGFLKKIPTFIPDPVLVEGATFDYGQLPADLAVDAQKVANTIRSSIGKVRGEIIEIGRELINMKERLPHGSFGPWIAAEFSMQERTAQNYMRAAAWSADKTASVADMSSTILYLISAPSTPKAVSEAVVAMVKAGQKPTVTVVKEQIAAAKTTQIKGIVVKSANHVFAPVKLAPDEPKVSSINFGAPSLTNEAPAYNSAKMVKGALKTANGRSFLSCYLKDPQGFHAAMVDWSDKIKKADATKMAAKKTEAHHGQS